MNKEEIIKSKAQIKNKWFETREDELDIALNVIDDLLVHIKKLEIKINTYENPEDMTLMFMWCDEKAKDKIKELQAKVNQLETNQDEVIKFIDNLHILQRSSYEYRKIKSLLTGDNSKL